MAQRKIDMSLSVDTKTGQVEVKKLSKEMKKVGTEGEKSASSLSTHWKNMKGPLAIATTAVVALYAAFKISKIGAELQQQEDSFRNLAASHGASADQILADMKRVSAGAVDTATLINKSGTAMMLGIAPENLADLMKIARSTARMTGQDVSEAFSDITMAVGRGSRMILDNLGIIVDVGKANEDYAKKLGIAADSLTDAEKKQAFMNATLEGGNELVERIGGGAITAAENFQAFGASMTNLKNSAIKLVSNALAPLVPLLKDAAEALSKILTPETQEESWVSGRAELVEIIELMKEKEELARTSTEHKHELGGEYEKEVKRAQFMIDSAEKDLEIFDRKVDKEKELIRLKKEEVAAYKKGIELASTMTQIETDAAEVRLTLADKTEKGQTAAENKRYVAFLENAKKFKNNEELITAGKELHDLKITAITKAGNAKRLELSTAANIKMLQLIGDDEGAEIASLNVRYAAMIDFNGKVEAKLAEEGAIRKKYKDERLAEIDAEFSAWDELEHEFHDGLASWKVEKEQTDRERLAEQRQKEFDAQVAALEKLEYGEEEHQIKMKEIRERYAEIKKADEKKQQEEDYKATYSYLRNKSTTFENQLAEMGKTGKKAAKASFIINRAFAIRESMIDTRKAVGKALGSCAPPGNYVLAAAALAYGMANVAAISKQRSPYAKGGVFRGGQETTAFADGGIVNRPTLFPMSNGTGLMGEAGPEAILPLKRGPGGKLGVESSGAKTGSTVNINLVNPTFQDIETQQQVFSQIAEMITRQIAPEVIVQNYQDDGAIRQMIRGGL